MENILTTLLFAVIIGLWFWTLYDFAMARFKKPAKKIIWLLIILLIPIGPLVYLSYRRKLIDKSSKKFASKFQEDHRK